MKIIAGEKRGRILRAPKGSATRPTLGRVRESLFSILGDRVVDARVADLFAGAGGLGLEALSRGAASCVFVERARPALEALRANVEALGFKEKSEILPIDVEKWLRMRTEPAAESRELLDLVFLDPPYDKTNWGELLEHLCAPTILSPDALIVVQCGAREKVENMPPALAVIDHRVYGETSLHFLLYSPP